MKGVIIPNHLGIILDGNRRWAIEHSLKPWEGHFYGAEKFEKFLEWCTQLKIPQVSAYVLSTENLNRPKRELDEIFKIYYKYLKKWESGKSDLLKKYEVNVKFVGDFSRLPPKLVRLM